MAFNFKDKDENEKLLKHNGRCTPHDDGRGLIAISHIKGPEKQHIRRFFGTRILDKFLLYETF